MRGIDLEYLTRKRFFKELSNTLNELDDKYLVTEIIKKPSFAEGKILKSTLEEMRKINARKC